jgi:hypothetical protein
MLLVVYETIVSAADISIQIRARSERMGKRHDIDKALRNMKNWADRSEWSDELSTVFDAHFAGVREHIDISPEEFHQNIVESDYGGMLFGIVFEDFLSRHLSPSNKNIIDDYLARRGLRESVVGRRYLQQLRNSVLSLYEVIQVSPGKHCELTDLVRGGKAIRVHENMGTLNMVKWDRIAARVLNTNGKYNFSGGILPFPHKASQELLSELTNSRKQFRRRRSRIADTSPKANPPLPKSPDDVFLRDACPAFTTVWLVNVLEQMQAPLPEIVNRDGASLVFCETRFPFLTEKAEEIAARLDAATDWVRDAPQKDAWIWLQESNATYEKPRGGLALNTSLYGQRPISGTLELTPGALTLLTNSLERAERGADVLQELLHNLIGPALSMLQTPEQLMADKTPHNSDRRHKLTDTIDPNTEAEIIHNTLDHHYRQCLDEPIPALDNKTPRQCARSKTGRNKVMEWLKQLENNELHRAAQAGQEPYDTSWMWDDLQLALPIDAPQ